MEILFLGNELLHQKATPIRPIDREYQKIALEMIEAMHRGKGCGLAGPQVGRMERIFVVHIEGDEPRVFINPSIIETSHEQDSYEEGCLSIPGIWAEVIRPKTVRVQAWNERGRPFTLEADGLLARAIQHEYDHLEGILFIDRLSEPRRNKILVQWKKRQRA
ncbi:MAG: peptide deformylase [Treponema sp.]|nr:peptide deformylase [Treponema sp.]